MPTLESLQGLRRRFLMLSGWHCHPIQVGVARYVNTIGGVLDSSQVITHQLPQAWKGDGIICMPGTDAALHDYLTRVDVPVVYIHRRPARHARRSVIVGQDDAAIGHAATEHLLGQGLRTTVFCLVDDGELDHPVAKGRIAGMQRVVESRGLPFHLVRVQHLERDLRDLPRPLGLIAQNDVHAVLALNTVLALGMSVPEDVAIMGCDNDEFHGSLSAVPLSSVETNCQLLGFRAAETVHQMVEGRSVSEHLRVPCGDVVVRASTTYMHIPHEPTAKAVAVIRERYRRDLDLDALADEVAMSRRRLEDRFVEFLGHSMAHELRRVRLNVARRLLHDQGMKLREVARLSGLGNEAYFSRIFRKETGLSPGAWRRRLAM